MGAYRKRPRCAIRKNPSSLPNCHYNTRRKGGRSIRKLKKSYETFDDAWEYIREHKLLDTYWPYLCPYCNKWHIGHINNQTLEPDVA